jgi:branched-subunit amino acid permease
VGGGVRAVEENPQCLCLNRTSVALVCPNLEHTKMKLLVAGILIGLVLGVMLTVIYFSLATFFGAESRRTAKQKSPEDSIKGGEVPQNMKARAGK